MFNCRIGIVGICHPATEAGKFSIRRLEERSEQLAAIHGSAVRANLETVRGWHALARKGALEA